MEEMEIDTAAAAAAAAADTSITYTSGSNIPTYTDIVVEPLPQVADSSDKTGPRLMITHIVNDFFKSYAGRQTLGPFHKSFSAIVGPNGSGKSNVIDSMLFVFGYRAKKIRSNKVSVLIHSSDKHRDVQSCTVTVHFQRIIDTGPGDEDYEIVPDSQFNVSRTGLKDNSSFYCVNGKRTTYKEVAVLLRASGIDLDHNRFLILQLNRVKLVEKDKDSLEGAKNEAIEYLTIENEIIRNRHALFQKYVHEGQENLEKVRVKHEQVVERRKQLDLQKDEFKTARKEKGKELKRVHEVYTALQTEVDKRKDEYSKIEREDAQHHDDIKHSRNKTKQIEKQLQQEIKKIEELKQIPEECEKKLEKLNNQLEKLEAEKVIEESNLQKVMDSLKTETEGMQIEKDEKEQKLLELQKSVNEARSKYTVAQSELDLILQNQQTEKAKLKDAEKNLEKTVDTCKQRKTDMKNYEKRVPEIENELQQSKKQLSSIVTEQDSLETKIRGVRSKLEEGRSAMQSSHNRGRVIDALMEEKQSGRIPGIYGRLGDLGAIDKKYDVAISTACGALEHIVTDNMSSAQRCVEFLKKTNTGLATFIGLDKMAKWKTQAQQKIKTPENAPRLFDLVKVNDELIRPAFYHALRDTLVATDMDQATRIAFSGTQRFRVVTLEGQLIDTSGTMSGGGKTACKGRMGSAIASDVDPKQIERMENDLQKDKDLYVSLSAKREKLEDTVRQCQSQLKKQKHDAEKCKMEIESLLERESSLKKDVELYKQSVKDAAPDDKKLKLLEKNVSSLKKVYDEASNTATKLEDEVRELQNKIMDVGGAKLAVVQNRLDMVNKQIDQIIGQITKSKVNAKTCARNLKKAEEKVKSLEEEQKENSENIVRLTEAMNNLTHVGKEVMDAFEKAKTDIQVQDDLLNEMKRSIKQLEDEDNQIDKELIEIKCEEEKHGGILKENQNKIKHWTKEMNSLKLHTIDSREPEALRIFTPEELSVINEYAVTVLEEKLAQMKPNMSAIAEYRKKEELYLKRVSELDHVTELRDKQRKQHETLRKQRLDEFMTGFTVITTRLKEMYQMITLGGDAELELVDSLDPFSEGIVFSVRPLKKSWKNISNLSGGEKTLSSLALVFALHHYKPTPLYVMDEIDAALDFKNVSIVAHYIKERTKNAQFIIISLRNNMFELADRLVGIYKTENCTKSCTINPAKISMQQITPQQQPAVTVQQTTPQQQPAVTQC
ncbi:structural maintenance of chromosomes protein 4-like isoform X2 [Tubulanus polymorphus]|uniref:structural maintenance of chromosomes protein 4-like isoform X2 n=1 Tax=Tubulanus polymorphus TaxID=672921 RepID=UPI003DA34F4C